MPFLANKNAELAVPPLLWPVNCIKIGGRVVLLSDPTVYSLHCDQGLKKLSIIPCALIVHRLRVWNDNLIEIASCLFFSDASCSKLV